MYIFNVSNLDPALYAVHFIPESISPVSIQTYLRAAAVYRSLPVNQSLVLDYYLL